MRIIPIFFIILISSCITNKKSIQSSSYNTIFTDSISNSNDDIIKIMFATGIEGYYEIFLNNRLVLADSLLLFESRGVYAAEIIVNLKKRKYNVIRINNIKGEQLEVPIYRGYRNLYIYKQFSIFTFKYSNNEILFE